jgi:hypothetical protein
MGTPVNIRFLRHSQSTVYTIENPKSSYLHLTQTLKAIYLLTKTGHKIANEIWHTIAQIPSINIVMAGTSCRPS